MIEEEDKDIEENQIQEERESTQQDISHESTSMKSEKISNSSNSKTKATCSLPENKKEQSINKNQMLQVQLIQKQQIKPQNMFYLRGELFIDLNFNDFSRISNLNYFKQVRSSSIIKEYGLLYTDYQVDAKLFDDHKKVVELLKGFQDQEVYTIAEKLNDHQLIQQKHSEIKQQIMKFSCMNGITSQLIQQKRQEFMLFRNQILKNLPKNKYFSFVDFSFDYTDQTFKMIGNGMNENFVKLLGCDLQSMQEILMRKGILDFIESKSRWRLLCRMIDTVKDKYTKDRHYEDRISVITLDDILVDTSFQADFYQCQANSIFENYFHSDYQGFLIDKGFLIFELQLTDFHLRKINNIRQKLIENHSQKGVYENIQEQFDHLYKPYILSVDDKSNSGDNMDIEDKSSSVNFYSETSNQESSTINQSNQSQFVQELITDIPYTIQSQYFLDKFYSKQKPVPKKDPKLQDQYPTKTCKYRLIEQI